MSTAREVVRFHGWLFVQLGYFLAYVGIYATLWLAAFLGAVVNPRAVWSTSPERIRARRLLALRRNWVSAGAALKAEREAMSPRHGTG